MLTVDPTRPGFFDDPYPFYAAIREENPVHQHPAGPWMLFRYDDVLRAVRDPALSVSELNAIDTPRNQLIGGVLGEGFLGRPTMPKSDPPLHTKLRRMLSRPFTPRMVEQMRTRVQEITDQLLDDATGSGDEVEFISTVAHPLPYRMICEILGMPPTDDRELLRWTRAVVLMLNPFLTADDVVAGRDANLAMHAFLTEVVAWKQDHLGDDLLSVIITGSEDGEALTPAEVVGQAQLLVTGGHETTVNAIGNGVLALLRNRDQWDLLCEQPDLVDNAVEELLRYDNTIQLAWRTTPTDYEIGGCTIPAGNHLVSWVASANRDPAKWGDTAEVLDITREGANEHVSFGGGAHLCLGAWLARLELQVLLRTLVERYPGTQLVSDDLTWMDATAIRGVEALPIRLA